MFYKALILISASSFFFYSVRSIFSNHMISEYSRWGLSRARIFISLLQFLLALSLIMGLWNLYLLLISSFFLTVMMIFAILVRVKIKDSLLDSVPAVFYALLNLSICYSTFLKFN